MVYMVFSLVPRLLQTMYKLTPCIRSLVPRRFLLVNGLGTRLCGVKLVRGLNGVM